MRQLRQWHQYLSVFFAPAIIFFAFSGLLQTTGFHENKGGGSYVPPSWIVMIASLHKDQRFPDASHEHHDGELTEHKHHGPPPGSSEAATWPLKFFVLCLSIGLMSTAALGIAIALRNRATRMTSLVMLGVGTLLPIGLLFI